eukprot:6318339-Karenia_brevis.AAC.1
MPLEPKGRGTAKDRWNGSRNKRRGGRGWQGKRHEFKDRAYTNPYSSKPKNTNREDWNKNMDYNNTQPFQPSYPVDSDHIIPRRDKQRHRDWRYDDEAQAMASGPRTKAPSTNLSQPPGQQQQILPE